jgi:hypothetical protein
MNASCGTRAFHLLFTIQIRNDVLEPEIVCRLARAACFRLPAPHSRQSRRRALAGKQPDQAPWHAATLPTVLGPAFRKNPGRSSPDQLAPNCVQSGRLWPLPILPAPFNCARAAASNWRPWRPCRALPINRRSACTGVCGAAGSPGLKSE